MWAAYQLRFHLLDYHADFSPGFYARLVVASILIWELIFSFYKLYHIEHLFDGVQEYGNVINGCTVGLVALTFYSFMDRRGAQEISRGWLAFVWLFSIVSIVLMRFGYRRVVYSLRRRGTFTRQALIVGANQEGREIISQLCNCDHAGIQIVGLVDPRLRPGAEFEGIPVLGGLGSLGDLIRRRDIEELIIIPTALSRESLLDIYRDWGTDDRVHVLLSSGVYELLTTGVRVQEVGFVPLLSLDKTRIVGISAVAKMAFDYVLALGGIVFLSPLFLALAALIKLDSRGPIFYRRRVIGMHGKVFDAFKFRTMITDADAFMEAHPELKREWDTTGKLQRDPRITRVGRVLRRFSLDELPQLFNVLRGEMSLVGPRMITPSEQSHFGRWQHNRLTVKPGLTGLWQVSGRSDLGYEDRVRLDMYYVQNHTVWLDLRVIFGTVSAVLSGKGAY
jgi:exopolysaccharide biosynthesis polyprenyl glycosylphosphotransferase